MPTLNVSIVIPAYNAAATINKTLESLQAQTLRDWEAIVVNDGSGDETAAIASQFAARDSRIRAVNQSQQGVCAARNKGISLARFDWLLFLDSDDWISPEFLEKMTSAIACDPSLDAVHCGWVRVTPDGQPLSEDYCQQSGDLFANFARTCAFAIHACIVRRSLVEAVGKFNPSLRTCEDWDLWQRIARTGARFGAVKEVLAYYRMRPDSVSIDGAQFLTDALPVIIQGHSPDPRVSNPKPAHANGQPVEQLPGAKFHAVCWAAGLMLSAGKDPLPLLEKVGEEQDPSLEPYLVAYAIFYAAIIPSCQSFSAWEQLWPGLENWITQFLIALEQQSMTRGLARRSQVILERLILEHSKFTSVCTVGSSHAVRLEVIEPIVDIDPPQLVEHLYCVLTMEGTELGRLELPVCDGLVTSWVLKDAIASQFAWQILGRFFEQTVYADNHPNAHNEIGWTVFLQQVWGRSDWESDRFYNPAWEEEVTVIQNRTGWLVVEVSTELPSVEVTLPEIDVALTVGGVGVGVVTIPVEQNFVTAQALRVALTTASGLELCRACVREALLGRSLSEKTSLRSRLAESAKAKSQYPESLAASGLASLLSSELSTDQQTVVLGRRAKVMGTPASRRAMLPSLAVQELVEMSAIAGEPLIQLPSSSQEPLQVVYAPEIIWRSPAPKVRSHSNKSDAFVPTYGRNHFETLFATQPDPWKYTSPYEQTKYEQTLSLIPKTRIHKALEIGCAEGHFTVQLAPKVDELIAADLSKIALERTAERCKALKNISFLALDLTKDPLPGRFDLIVSSEVLYYVGGKEELSAIASKFADALEPGGYLLMAHGNQIIDQPDKAGFDWGLPFGAKVIGETFASASCLRLIKEICTPLYRVHLFQRQPRLPFLWNHQKPKIINFEQQPTPLPPEVEAFVRWQGGESSFNSTPEPIFTSKLPILMYHRVAPTGLAAMTRYRVTPEQFEEQLRYLRDAGFSSVEWEEWQTAILTKQPVPGQKIAITFDDGYLDLFHYAGPLLKQYGFTATVFLVSDRIGCSNSWDKAYGEEVPLMGWQEIRQLRDEGIEFGSHCATHQPLTALSVAEVVKEGARSRSILERQLGVPIQTIAYPYGDVNPVVQHLMGACGYTFGFSCRSGWSSFQDQLLDLPRIEVMGSDTLQDFVAKLT
jgi:peptidoglycan/xylan/chitin deacetylase (PgdA/CDA1 family)